jgi:deoxyhypusine synthase
MNRIGNLVVPNDNYCKFEDWLMPLLDTMLEEQKRDGTVWTPSSIIHRLGKEINNEESVYYWAYKVKHILRSRQVHGTQHQHPERYPSVLPGTH